MLLFFGRKMVGYHGVAPCLLRPKRSVLLKHL